MQKCCEIILNRIDPTGVRRTGDAVPDVEAAVP